MAIFNSYVKLLRGYPNFWWLANLFPQKNKKRWLTASLHPAQNRVFVTLAVQLFTWSICPKYWVPHFHLSKLDIKSTCQLGHFSGPFPTLPPRAAMNGSTTSPNRPSVVACAKRVECRMDLSDGNPPWYHGRHCRRFSAESLRKKCVICVITPRMAKSIWKSYLRCSMYGICSYIWMIFVVNVDTYSIHGAYGYEIMHHVKNMIVDMGTNGNLEDVEARITVDLQNWASMTVCTWISQTTIGEMNHQPTTGMFLLSPWFRGAPRNTIRCWNHQPVANSVAWFSHQFIAVHRCSCPHSAIA